MDNRNIAGWLNRMDQFSQASFDADAALALAREIKDGADNANVSYRALQAVYVLERCKPARRGAVGRMADMKSALAPVRKALQHVKAH